MNDYLRFYQRLYAVAVNSGDLGSKALYRSIIVVLLTAKGE